MIPLIPVYLASSLGIISHVFYFIQGEHHINAPQIFRGYIISCICVYVACRVSQLEEYSTALPATALLVSVYAGSLLGSIAVYRIFFHRTGAFSGPFLARVTKFYHTFKARNSDQHLWLDHLHEKYGDYVRTGKQQPQISTFTDKY